MTREGLPFRPPRALILAAFATVYIVWGSTYLAIRVAIETLPPFLMAACRLLTAGLVLLVFLRVRGAPQPTQAQWRHAGISGVLMLAGGNGLVVWSEQTVSSGLTALLVSLVPVWFAMIDWLRPGGSRPEKRTVLGILIGFGGMILLVAGDYTAAGNSAFSLWGALALLVAGVSWAAGSLYSKHHSQADSPWMTAALQMVCGGGALLLLAGVTGEWGRADWENVSASSLAALAYLIVFGSWLGYGAYVWLLKASKPAHVATYAYVNPVIALFLGWLVMGEPLDGRVLLAAAIILSGVIIITLPREVFVNRLPRAIFPWPNKADPQA